jgi:G6PDH family F420-dependent oxidoreductase
MLSEAIDIIRQLWRGGYQSYEGQFFQLDSARIFDLPAQQPAIFIAAGGPMAARLAARCQAGLCVTEPKEATISAFTEEGGDPNSLWGQVIVSWDTSKETAVQAAHDQFRFSAGGWPVQAELPNPANFAAATQNVRPEDIAQKIPCGPDVSLHSEAIKRYTQAGVTHLALAYPGSNHRGFMEFWRHQLQPAIQNEGR